MSDTIVAQRYARALYEDAEEAGQVEAVDADIALIQDTLAGTRELVLFFQSPIISREKKAAVVQELFGPRLQPLTLRFMELLIEKKRETIFPAIVAAYRDLRDRQRGIIEARAKVAQSLAADEEAKLVGALEQMTGKRIRLHTEVAPELLGGVVVRVGDTVYDGSVQNKLITLREQLEQGAFTEPNLEI